MFVIEYNSEAWQALVAATTRAALNDQKVSLDRRIGGLAIKVGEGMWTPTLDIQVPRPVGNVGEWLG